jgi:hypothetical protein
MVDNSLAPELEILGLVRVHEEELVLLPRNLELAGVVASPSGLPGVVPVALAMRVSSWSDEGIGSTIKR